MCEGGNLRALPRASLMRPPSASCSVPMPALDPSSLLLPLAGAAFALLLLGGYRWALRPSVWLEFTTALLFVVGFLCGLIGFLADAGPWDQHSWSDWIQRVANAIHRSLQLIMLEANAEDTQGLLLGIARLLLPFVTAQLVFTVILRHLAQWRMRLDLALPFGGPEVVVLGCGETGRRIAEWYTRHPRRRLQLWRHRVVGVDSRTGHEDVLDFQHHFPVFSEPLALDQTLAALYLYRRPHIVICTGEDASDLELARRVVRVLDMRNKKRRKTKETPRIVVTVETTGISRACLFDARLSRWYDSGRLEFLNVHHAGARLLLLKHPPHELWPGRFHACQPNPCHVAIYGSGLLLAELISQAVRALVYDPYCPLRVTIFTRQAKATEREFFARFPALSGTAVSSGDPAYGAQLPLAHLEFVESWYEQLHTHAVRSAHAQQRLDVLYVIGESDAEVSLLVAEALKVSSVLPEDRPAVVACIRSSLELRPFDRRAPVKFSTFRLEEWARPADVPSKPSASPDDLGDEVAKRVWWRYKMPTEPYDDAVASHGWETVPHHEKWESRYAGDHAQAKLKLLGLKDDAPKAGVARAVKAHAEWLCRLEHRRYVCERLTDGWVRCEGEKIKPYHLNPTLGPFEALSDTERAKDQEIVASLNHVCDAVRALRLAIQGKP